jgi:hypothetical protein
MGKRYNNQEKKYSVIFIPKRNNFNPLRVILYTLCPRLSLFAVTFFDCQSMNKVAYHVVHGTNSVTMMPFFLVDSALQQL